MRNVRTLRQKGKHSCIFDSPSGPRTRIAYSRMAGDIMADLRMVGSKQDNRNWKKAVVVAIA